MGVGEVKSKWGGGCVERGAEGYEVHGVGMSVGGRVPGVVWGGTACKGFAHAAIVGGRLRRGKKGQVKEDGSLLWPPRPWGPVTLTLIPPSQGAAAGPVKDGQTGARRRRRARPP